MHPRVQFVHPAGVLPAVVRATRAGLLLGTLVLCAAIARAQNAPPLSVGQVEGNDISVEGGAAARSGTATVAPSIYVSNGSTVTVHSGRARMTLFAGGKLDICGPAKFTVLLSGDSITLALNFGRVRVQLPAQTSLRVFSPTIIATPLEISGGARDVTVGLNLDDSLCVLATSGAIQLEHQFTGERLIVPQAGEFFLNSGRLVPVAGTPGSCQCFADEQRGTPPPTATPPEFAIAAPPPAEPKSASSPTASSEPPVTSAVPIAEPSVEFSIPAHANEAHPVTPSARNAQAAPPPAAVPIYTVVLPPLTFSASSPAPPPDPTPDMFLLIREARVLPEWEFTGRVEVPGFIGAMQNALGEKHAADEPAQAPKSKKGGFWASLKRLFGGGGKE